MPTIEQAEQAAQEYLTKTYQPLAACSVKAGESGREWVVEAAIVRDRRGKPTLEVYRMRFGPQLELLSCDQTRAAPIAITYVSS